MDSLFTKKIADELRIRIRNKNPWEREKEIMDHLCRAISDKSRRFVSSFRFKSGNKNRTSHYLVHVTKNIKGYSVMKEVMANASSSKCQGVATFEYDPTAQDEDNLLIGPLDELKEDLRKQFTGKTLSMHEVFTRHNVGTRFIKANYKMALCDLEKQHFLTAAPPMNKRRSGTFGDSVLITFQKYN